MKLFNILFIILFFAVSVPQAFAQMGMSPGMRNAGKREDEKPMVIKKAKEDIQKEDDNSEEGDDYLNRPPSFQLFTMDGYMRTRSDLMYRLDLGLHPHVGIASPFNTPVTAYTSSCNQANAPARCHNHTLTSTNMRLRLNPVLRPSDNISIYSTMDIFDNMVLGSSPSGGNLTYGTSSWVPYPGYTGTQAVSDQGVSSSWDAIRVKNLWGSVDLKLFELRFGRMPDHFGMGIRFNNGFGLDDDFGDSVDTIQIVTQIPAWNLELGASWDFLSQGMNSSVLHPDYTQGQPVDLTDQDDASGWTFYAVKQLSPSALKKALASGKSVFNYGARLSLAKQNYTLKIPQTGDTPVLLTSGNSPSAVADNLYPRKTMFATPDFWMLYARKNFSFELESVLNYGWIENLGDVSGMGKSGHDMDIFQYGGVMKFNYRWNSNLHIGLEFGYASGDDQYENTETRGNTYYRDVPSFPVNGKDKYNTMMMFHPSYHVDLIFFREIMGTVYNASYLKPTLTFKHEQWFFKGSGIVSFANEPVATPGNDYLYGMEGDADLAYKTKDGRFIIGISYGVFFPMDALKRPVSIYGTFAAEPSVAHTIQGRIILKF